MAKDFGDFGKRMQIRAEETITNLERTMRRAALAADRELVMRTPVDTGRARANWLASVRKPDHRETEDVDPGGAVAMATAQSKIGRFRLADRTIWISNSLPYIKRLDEGHSPQAPQGMTEFAVEAARTAIRRSRLLP